MQTTFRRLGTMLDCSRNGVMTVEAVKKWIDLTSDIGYNCVLLYVEDTYEVEGQPYFGYLRGRYTQAEMTEIDSYAAQKGVEVIPCIQTLAHLNAIFRWAPYAPLRDCNDILLAGDERVYALIEDMFATLSRCFRSKVVNIGMDEAHMLGHGKYMDEHGVRDRYDILLEHLQKVADIGRRYDRELIMWGDMFFRMYNNGEYYANEYHVTDEVKNRIPANVSLIYWDYYFSSKEHYDQQIDFHNAVKPDSWFAGGLWSWTGYAPHNGYTLLNTIPAVRSCREKNVRDVFFTLWGDNGNECSKFALLPSLYYTAELAKGNDDEAAIKAGFEKKYGIAYDDFLLLDLPDTANSPTAMTNPDKYMLYNDLFLGIYDSTVTDGYAASYGACAERLRRMEDHPEWGYLFRTMRTLCEVLAIKYDLGVRTRTAYQAKDKDALRDLLPAYEALPAKLRAFYEAVKYQWMRENKPHGFEILDLRFGGMIARAEHCRDRLRGYLAGETDRIPELEEKLLDAYGYGEKLSGEIGYQHWWSSAVSPNIV